FRFTLSGNTGIGDPDVSDRLTRLLDGGGNTTGWTYATANDEVELYNANGVLQSITNRGGLVQTLTYSDASTPTSIAPYPGLLIKVTDPLGRALTLTYDYFSRVSTMTDPAGGVTTYGYTDHALTSRTDPNGTTRTYVYNEQTYTSSTNLPYALTGIVDENN